MKLNSYIIRDPVSIKESDDPFYTTFKVPFSHQTILDEGLSEKKESWSIILIDNQLNDVLGMFEMSRIVFVEFDEIKMFYYVGNVSIDWIKRMDKHKLTKLTIEMFPLTKRKLLRLSYFKNYQKTDFGPITEPAVITLPDDTYAIKTNLAPNFYRVGMNGINIKCWKDPVQKIYFHCADNIYKDGLIRFTDEKGQFWKDKLNYAGNPKIETGMGRFNIIKSDANRYLQLDTPSVPSGQLSLGDGVNNVDDNDVEIKLDPFEAVFKIKYAEFVVKYGDSALKILNTGSLPLIYPDERLKIITYPWQSYGYKERTTTDPSKMILDTSIGGTVPTQLAYEYDPGFIHWSVDEDGSNPKTNMFCTSSTKKITTLRDRFSAGTKHHYITPLPLKCFYVHSNQMSVGAGTWTSYSNGKTYEGITNYRGTSGAGNLTTTFATDISNGYYMIYAMVRNINPAAAMSFKFYLDANDKGTVTFATGDGGNAYIVFLGDYFLGNTSHTFKFERASGNFGLFYFIVVPRNCGVDCPYNIIRQNMNDHKQAFEVD
ncbi:MAG: hypothetical protein QHH15_04895 [Candidatus Thermoplasmatota archaeon]|nr:hypothetical protein [Candidatus Thermoplasmatota archaeon]